MPIRLNLLAEEQAAEELRRKDPVKRALWAAGGLIVLMLLWCAWLEVQLLSAGVRLKSLQKQWQLLEKANQQVLAHRKETLEIQSHLAALERLSTNRLLWGATLNALQQTLRGVEDIQVVRLKADQNFLLTEEIKPRPAGGATNKVRTASTNKIYYATEKATMLIEAIDASTPPGAQVSRFGRAIQDVPYFAQSLQKTTGMVLFAQSPPQIPPTGGKPVVVFSYQCSFPEKTNR
jgi:hypothetical protein